MIQFSQQNCKRTNLAKIKMCCALFVKAIQNTWWSKMAMWKFIPGLLKSEYQVKISKQTCNCLQSWGQYHQSTGNRQNLGRQQVNEKFSVSMKSQTWRALCEDPWRRNHLCTLSWIQISKSLIPSSQSFHVQWVKYLHKIMVQLSDKILFANE